MQEIASADQIAAELGQTSEARDVTCLCTKPNAWPHVPRDCVSSNVSKLGRADWAFGFQGLDSKPKQEGSKPISRAVTCSDSL